MKDIIKTSDGMDAFDDQHYLGAREVIKALGGKTVIKVVRTDWLFKGYGLENKYKQLFGKNLPYTKLTKNRIDAFLPNYPNKVPEEYQNKVKERLNDWFGNVPQHFDKG